MSQIVKRPRLSSEGSTATDVATEGEIKIIQSIIIKYNFRKTNGGSNVD